ncbi:MAG TPA: prepilin-type N-terminal cleavage/methylation domain-containing protein [Candidatus Paceibacterota bacterium]
MQSRGFSLLEVLIGIAILAVISLALFESYAKVITVMQAGRFKILASELAGEEFEIARNLSYSNVGIGDGIPLGLIPHVQTLTRGGVTFIATTTVRNIDDPFDGTIGSTTKKDLSPADYKLVAVEIGCLTCESFFVPITFTTNVGPKNLESASTNGALFINVFDAGGLPVVGANIHIENTAAGGTIVIDDVTDENGQLQIIDVPPGAGVYAITATKSNYSLEQTYPPGGFDIPNPVHQHATIAAQTLTETSFAIDKTSTLNITSSNDTCSATPDVDFTLTGSKLIGTSPDIIKYSKDKVTNGSGVLTVSGLEWDTYKLALADGEYDLAGSIPNVPLAINPDVSQDLRLIVTEKDPKELLVSVKDVGTSLPISGATVTLSEAGFTSTLTTGRGFLRQTDWSGADGQDDFIDPARYFSSDGNLDTATPAGDVNLLSFFGAYQPSGELISSTFDTGSPSNFQDLSWQPQSEPPETGADSVKFQLASNNDKATWNFTGPDGTSGSYYTIGNGNISSDNNGNRYLRYKMLLSTASTTYTPTVSDVAFTFTSDCVPSGQVFFHHLSTGDYTLSVDKSGYQSYSGTVTVSSPWQETSVSLSP